MSPFTGRDTPGLEGAIIRAAFDAAFRRDLLRDPVHTLTHAMQVVLPPGLRVRFVERDPDVDLMIVLPDLTPQDVGLTLTDLEHVAGAWSWSGAWHDAHPTGSDS